jgi:hypothetical protein
MSEEKNIPEGQPESNNHKSPQENINALSQGSEEPNISKEELVLPAFPLSKIEQQQTAITEPSSLTPHPSTMEVHHHGHVHEKKKWKEYLFQFLMLFLAVFCGFLAEYQLEQTIERHREKDYIKSFTEDLQADLEQIARIIPSLKRQKLGLDTLNYDLHNSQVNTATLYYYARLSTRPVSFLPSDRTIIQLKNSGGFRLITNKQSVDSIMAYEGLLNGYQYFLMRENDEIQHLLPLLSKLFNASVFDTMVDSANQFISPSVICRCVQVIPI